MSEIKGGVYLTQDELQKLMGAAMASAVAEARKMSPLEERRYNEELAREKRRDRMAVELAKAEAQNQWNRQHGCSHKIDSKTGLIVSRDRADGLWCTSGQMHGNDLATLICQRCAFVWRWRTNAGERDYINNAGMLYMAPPAQELVDAFLKEEAERDRLTLMREDMKPAPAA